MKETINYFKTKSTEECAQFLLGMYLEYTSDQATLGGYIVDTEAYLGEKDEAAHSFGLKKTPRLEAMYEEYGTIYLYSIHTQLILNIVTKEKGNPQGVMIRAIEPVEGLNQMIENRNKKQGFDLSNGPGKLVKALGITKQLYGQSIFSSTLTIVPAKRKRPKEIEALPRIGIPNKGIWTKKSLRFVVSGNPYISQQRKNRIEKTTYGWEE